MDEITFLKTLEKIKNLRKEFFFSVYELSSLDQIERLNHILEKNTVIQELTFSFCSMREEFKEYCFAFLKKNTSVTSLHLHQNNIGPAVVSALANALTENNTLQVLNIQRCSIGDEGILHFLQELKKNTSVKALTLSRTDSTSEGIKHIANFLAEKTHFHSLSLDANKVDDESLFALIESLKLAPQLKHLVLSRNKITDIGAKALAEFIRHHRTLEYFDFSWNQVSETGLAYFLPAIIENRSLTKCILNLSDNEGNTFKSESHDKIIEFLIQRNEALEQVKHQVFSFKDYYKILQQKNVVTSFPVPSLYDLALNKVSKYDLPQTQLPLEVQENLSIPGQQMRIFKLFYQPPLIEGEQSGQQIQPKMK